MAYYEQYEINYIRDQKRLAKRLITQAATTRENAKLRQHILASRYKPHLHQGEWMALLECPQGRIVIGDPITLKQMAKMIAEGTFEIAGIDPQSEMKRKAKHLLRTAYLKEVDPNVQTSLKELGYEPHLQESKWTTKAMSKSGEVVTLSHQEQIQMAILMQEGFYGNEHS